MFQIVSGPSTRGKPGTRWQPRTVRFGPVIDAATNGGHVRIRPKIGRPASILPASGVMPAAVGVSQSRTGRTTRCATVSASLPPRPSRFKYVAGSLRPPVAVDRGWNRGAALPFPGIWPVFHVFVGKKLSDGAEDRLGMWHRTCTVLGARWSKMNGYLGRRLARGIDVRCTVSCSPLRSFDIGQSQASLRLEPIRLRKTLAVRLFWALALLNCGERVSKSGGRRKSPMPRRARGQRGNPAGHATTRSVVVKGCHFSDSGRLGQYYDPRCTYSRGRKTGLDWG